MELKEFITKTLKDITDGVLETNQYLKDGEKGGFELYPNEDGSIIFDIAVTIGENSDTSKGGGIKVYALNLGGVKNNSNSNETVSRIKFKVKPSRRIY
jgi:hypothetical protein